MPASRGQPPMTLSFAVRLRRTPRPEPWTYNLAGPKTPCAAGSASWVSR